MGARYLYLWVEVDLKHYQAIQIAIKNLPMRLAASMVSLTILTLASQPTLIWSVIVTL